MSKHIPLPCPSLAQTHMQGPMINGSGKSLTEEELEQVRVELAKMKEEYGLEEPERAFMDEVDTVWMFDGVPDYSLTNYFYLKERTKCHPKGSLANIVENLVKTWEMERSHKPDCSQHRSTAGADFRFSANGGKVFNNVEAHQVGNYNVLLNTCPRHLYDAENTSFTDSHEKFHKAFAAFPWEVLDVFSGPPKVAFSWRHWAHFTGEYEENRGNGELVEMFGFATATLNDKMQICDLEIYFNGEEFISVLKGLMKPEDANVGWKRDCPHLEKLKKERAAKNGKEKQAEENEHKAKKDKGSWSLNLSRSRRKSGDGVAR